MSNNASGQDRSVFSIKRFILPDLMAEWNIYQYLLIIARELAFIIENAKEVCDYGNEFKCHEEATIYE